MAWRWDLDHDGVFNEPVDKNGEVVQWSITNPGVYPVTLRVESSTGLTDTVELVVDASNIPPVPTIDEPDADLELVRRRDDHLQRAPRRTPRTARSPPHASTGRSGILHCGPNDCHEHPVQSFHGVAGWHVRRPPTTSTRPSSCSAWRRPTATGPCGRRAWSSSRRRRPST